MPWNSTMSFSQDLCREAVMWQQMPWKIKPSQRKPLGLFSVDCQTAPTSLLEKCSATGSQTLQHIKRFVFIFWWSESCIFLSPLLDCMICVLFTSFYSSDLCCIGSRNWSASLSRRKGDRDGVLCSLGKLKSPLNQFNCQNAQKCLRFLRINLWLSFHFQSADDDTWGCR